MEIDLRTHDRRALSAVEAADRGEFDYAKSVVIDLIAEDWNNAQAHRAWGRVLLAEGKTADAVAAYRTAVSLDPRRADVHFDLAEALLADFGANPFTPHTSWVEAREAVSNGLARTANHARGNNILARIEQARATSLT